MSSTSSQACSSRPPRDSSPSRLCPKALLERARRDRRRCSRPPAGAGRSSSGASGTPAPPPPREAGGCPGRRRPRPPGRRVARLCGVVPHARRVVHGRAAAPSAAAAGRPPPAAQQPHDAVRRRDRDDHGDGDDLLESAHSRRFSQRSPGAYDVSPARRRVPAAAAVGRSVGAPSTGAAPGGRGARSRGPARGRLQHPGQDLLAAGAARRDPSRLAGTATSPTTTMATPTTEQQTENQGDHASRVPAARATSRARHAAL